MDFNKLKGKMRESNKSYRECAKMIGISTASFNSKMNGRTRFYIDELEELAKILDMTFNEKANIFLDRGGKYETESKS